MKNKVAETQDPITMLHIRMPKSVHKMIVKAKGKSEAKSGTKKTLSDAGLELIIKGLDNQ